MTTYSNVAEGIVQLALFATLGLLYLSYFFATKRGLNNRSTIFWSTAVAVTVIAFQGAFLTANLSASQYERPVDSVTVQWSQFVWVLTALLPFSVAVCTYLSIDFKFSFLYLFFEVGWATSFIFAMISSEPRSYMWLLFSIGSLVAARLVLAFKAGRTKDGLGVVLVILLSGAYLPYAIAVLFGSSMQAVMNSTLEVWIYFIASVLYFVAGSVFVNITQGNDPNYVVKNLIPQYYEEQTATSS
jgi:hypothetical protein